jgi:hypothetical protein
VKILPGFSFNSCHADCDIIAQARQSTKNETDFQSRARGAATRREMYRLVVLGY